jgi:hypothetical protein
MLAAHGQSVWPVPQALPRTVWGWTAVEPFCEMNIVKRSRRALMFELRFILLRDLQT